MDIPDSYYSSQQEAIHLAEEGPFLSERELVNGQEGLTKKEMLCLRLGVVLGQGSSDVVPNRFKELAPLCSTKELWQLFAEAVLIRGEQGRNHLVYLLEEFYPGGGWRDKTPAQLIEFSRTNKGIPLPDRLNGQEGLTKRELSLFGIGLTFGARCWYT